MTEVSAAQARGARSVEGETPIALLELIVDGDTFPVRLKLEGESPGGSIKDRTARWLLQDPEVRSRLEEGARMIESTSGNLGVALAQLARDARLELTAVIDPRTTPEIAARMVELGARLEVVDRPDPSEGFLLSRLARVRELCASEPELVWPNQYASAANPAAHEHETGPEIHRQLDGAVDAVLVAVSTGGTLAGIARYFRRASPRTRIVAVDIEGSVALGGAPGPRPLSGIGASQRSRFLTSELHDAAITVSAGEAVMMCHTVAAASWLRLGASSGAVLAAATRYLRGGAQPGRVVCVCPDGGERYESTIYDPGWLEDNGLPQSPEPPAGIGVGSASRLGDALPRFL